MNEIKKIRLSKNLTQKEVADYLGISERNLRNWETGAIKVPELKIPAILQMIKKMKKKRV